MDRLADDPAVRTALDEALQPIRVSWWHTLGRWEHRLALMDTKQPGWEAKTETTSFAISYRVDINS